MPFIVEHVLQNSVFILKKMFLKARTIVVPMLILYSTDVLIDRQSFYLSTQKVTLMIRACQYAKHRIMICTQVTLLFL